MSLRDWLQWLCIGQAPKREVGEARQNPMNEDERLSDLATLIDSDDFNEASLNRMADLIGQTDPNRGRFE